MNKSELVEKLAERAKITKKRARIGREFGVRPNGPGAAKRGERIEIRGFGSFTSKAYEAYTGRNPRTGETIHVPAKRLPFFKVGKELKERVDYPQVARTNGAGGAPIDGDDDDEDDLGDEDEDGDDTAD
jgi:integration host factor subunit beta